MEEVFVLKNNEDAIIDLVIPLSEISFNINNQMYAEYESQELFLAE
jgi:hypothetical protein